MKDPARLLDNPGSDLDVLLLESGLDEEPPAHIADRTLVALGVASVAVGAGAGAVGASAASIKAAGTLGWWAGPWALVAKVGIGVAVVGGVVGGGYAVLTPPSGRAPRSEPAAIVAPGAPQAEDQQDVGAGAAREAEPTTNDAEARASEPAEPAGSKVVEAAPGSKPPVSHATDASKPVKLADPAKPGAVKPSTEPAKAAEGGSTLAQERQLIESARASLRNGDKAGAIATLDSYPGRFPKGQLKNEVAAMRQAIAASP